tara:strand:+ start:1658 stop:2449 length:792 start_codon:yes stop_codon:yes gene_type:complete
MDKGFTWFALNNSTTDYIDLSRKLASSIKRHNKHNQVCIITDKPVKHTEFDHVVVLKENFSEQQEWKLNNEWQIFKLTPFKHTIKLEADMLFTANTDWWWNHLHQHNMVFSYHCRSYTDSIVKHTPYRDLYKTNNLPDIYNALTYFRTSRTAQYFYTLCENIIKHWPAVRSKFLINCHDDQPTTDVVYALALKIIDPIQESRVTYDFFNFMHNKNGVNGLTTAYNNDQYLYTMQVNGEIYSGGYKQSRIFHYHNKKLAEELHE